MKILLLYKARGKKNTLVQPSQANSVLLGLLLDATTKNGVFIAVNLRKQKGLQL